jgi:hypothetical protein
MATLIRKVWQRIRSRRPVQGFFFDRPLLVLQSDDWGRVGVRDREGMELLRQSGLSLGERPYDFYSLETAEDLAELSQLLKRHRDASGRPACLGMNFIMANLDFTKMETESFRQLYLRALPEGLPEGWRRPGLFEAYREGIEAGVFYPALHGQLHFCRASAERELTSQTERADLLKCLWRAGTPYIHWRMPWVGYEYWDPELPSDRRFVSADAQDRMIGAAVGDFARLFSTLPRSACAPGYRANEDTHKAWAQFGVRVAQNGPGGALPPHLDEFGLLHLHRSLDFEPALEADLSIEASVAGVEDCWARAVPAIVSIHSINFHSSLKDFRSRTLEVLDQFLSSLETKHPDLLYVNDGDLYDLVESGTYAQEPRSGRVQVSKRLINRGAVKT